MNICINSFSSSIRLCQEYLLPSLNTQQRKILVIASMVFGFIAMSYMVWNYCFRVRELNGKGKKIYDDTTEEQGEFKNDILHGQGTRKHPDGVIEQGQFNQGVLDGGGKLTFNVGSMIQAGGKSHKSYSNGVYEGLFKDGEMVYGKKMYPDGTILEGKFEDHIFVGSRKFNGLVEVGLFEGGALFKGMRTNPDGTEEALLTEKNGIKIVKM